MADSCGGEVGWADISRSARTDSLHTTGAPHVMDRGAARCLFSTLALTNQSLAITLAHAIHLDLPGPRVFCKKKVMSTAGERQKHALYGRRVLGTDQAITASAACTLLQLPATSALQHRETQPT